MRSRSNSGIRLDYFQRLVNKSILKYQNVSTGLITTSIGETADHGLFADTWIKDLHFNLYHDSRTKHQKDNKKKEVIFAVVDEDPEHEQTFHYKDSDDNSPSTGLISCNDNDHAWVRDNIYCVMAVWGLALAYKKTLDLDEDRAKAYELEKAVVSVMRGLLRSMQMQTDKVEQFKRTQSPRDALHAKYNSHTGKTVVGDYEWGHLQIDATSLFLLALAQMTASGVIIVNTLDEVAFVQNLVFYIETAYRCPDYGIWERGDKTNHGLPELNASSIGMAKAALEAINELDLFGSRGGLASIIHVLPDEAQQCQAILQSMLPRESISKEIDASLLTIVSFPAFAVDDPDLIERTQKTIREKLEGHYGCSRFLRDGYKTAKEDVSRLHYEPWELLVFENIECQWPLFFAFLILDGLFNKDKAKVEKYTKKLDAVLLRTQDGIPIVPELYTVPKEAVAKEYDAPKTQDRVAAGKVPHMWGQSMYILGRLMIEGFLSPGELDPLNRRHVTEPKPDVVVQVVLLAEDEDIQDKLALHGFDIQTVAEVAPIQIHPARVLSKLYGLLGKNKRMNLSGRAPSSEIGLLATSKLYMHQDKILAFVPQLADSRQFYLGFDIDFMVDNFKTKLDFLCHCWKSLGRPLIVLTLGKASLEFLDGQRFYMVLDTNFLVDFLRTEVAYLKHSWKAVGRPLLTITITKSLLDHYQQPPNALLATIKKLQSGYISGTRVHLGTLKDFLNTSCITKLSFLEDIEDRASKQDQLIVDQLISQNTEARPRLLSNSSQKGRSRPSFRASTQLIQGIVRRSRSIQIDPEEIPDMQALLSQYETERSRSSTGGSSERQNSDTGSPRSRSPEFTNLSQFAVSDSSAISSHHHLKDEVDMGGTKLSPQPSSPKASRKQLKPMEEHFTGEEMDVTELVEQLKESSNLQEQADIIHYLYAQKGPDWDTHMESDRKVSVKELLVELYEKAGSWKQWWLVRHTSGMLRKRVEDLALAATDLLVRQKQLSVGLPPDHEIITTSPLPPDELAGIIYDACGEDHSTASLTQEILVYLAMFIRTEPNLFDEMLRLRVGLIIQVMASELSRTLRCSGEEASDHLLNLSPFEMKTLLHHILSGKEFVISSAYSDVGGTSLAVKSLHSKQETSRFAALSTKNKNNSLRKLFSHGMQVTDQEEDDHQAEIDDRQGQWLRRRRLDGSLNRVPLGFYPLLWELLHRCRGIYIKGNFLPGTLTREMTKGEFKFALQVEMVLNQIPQPEYRQLMVEAIMVMTTVVENDNNRINLSQMEFEVDRIVHEANRLFVNDMKLSEESIEQTLGAAAICIFLYDSAPSGRFGSMSYMCRALSSLVKLPLNSENALECSIS